MEATTKKRRGCCGSRKIHSRLRFDYSSPTSPSLTCEEVTFGGAVHKYLAQYGKLFPTCGEILDVMMNLGYKSPGRDFEKLVHEFTAAVHLYKKKQGKPFPTWSEVLDVAKKLGWQKPD